MKSSVEALKPHLSLDELEAYEYALATVPEAVPFATEEETPADIIRSSFVWARSPQGHAYWNRIYDRLKAKWGS